MVIYDEYDSPIGKMILVQENHSLVGAYFIDQNHIDSKITTNIKQNSNLLTKVKNKLDSYFNRENPDFTSLIIHLKGTIFQKKVWNILLTIPYGETRSYSDIARLIAQERGISKMSSQAVGQAISKNPICIIVPCHRVIGKNNKLIGYAGGVDKKAYLLELEKNHREKLI